MNYIKNFRFYRDDLNEKYFRPSPLSVLNVKDFNSEFWQKYSNKSYNEITLPDWLLKSPEDTIINYFSLLREAENISTGGCGTIGLSKAPYPIAYSFLTSKYQSTMGFKDYLNLFKDIGHINLIKLKNITNENTPKGTYKYFIEIETIEPSVNGNTSFAYYYGFVYIENEGGKYKISNIDLRGQDFLCAAYHGWRHNAELYVDTVYGGWCGLIKKRSPTVQKGYIKNIYVAGTDGHEYRFEFFQLTNGTDIEIQLFVKNANNQWEPITIDVEKCLKRWACHYCFYKL